ncbi:cysteine dioxygenase [Corallococcus macrosporus]|uniref:Cysteine dioxygenase n=1 Tax=Myxococcus fulvus (strain ATCC BAA-855 / HW-1) TaxID=483219 RepID=F8CKS3_MYXFH|nr:cysteine dioxygenase family protein [Corallococcus macrosporus]AEI62738.1 cysteine dioxygenase [Corallococcus macrosporus]
MAAALLGWSLPERPDAVVSVAWLVERLRSSRVDWGLLEKLVRFEPAGYARQTLARTPACELLLISWLPGQASRVHDHGGSGGASWLVRGALRETRYAWAGDRLAPDVVVGASEGDVLVELPDTIHRIDNASRHGAVSLHLYAPPLRGMTSYEEARLARETLRPPRPPAGSGGPGRRRRPRAT